MVTRVHGAWSVTGLSPGFPAVLSTVGCGPMPPSQLCHGAPGRERTPTPMQHDSIGSSATPGLYFKSVLSICLLHIVGCNHVSLTGCNLFFMDRRSVQAIPEYRILVTRRVTLLVTFWSGESPTHEWLVW